ncbi:MAG: VOC family protein [Candidatus Hydrogenedentes bacterium]|nr:VOC family protein [Candidatus Hydrogenedentota bacterium]
MYVQPYLFFNGCCDEALEFYEEALGAEVLMVMRYKESPEPRDPKMVTPEMGDKVMHACFRVGETEVLASDGHCTGSTNFQGFSLSITMHSGGDADRIFDALADSGQVAMPLTQTFYSPKFGMVTDKFGILWMIMVATKD